MEPLLLQLTGLLRGRGLSLGTNSGTARDKGIQPRHRNLHSGSPLIITVPADDHEGEAVLTDEIPIGEVPKPGSDQPEFANLWLVRYRYVVDLHRRPAQTLDAI